MAQIEIFPFKIYGDPIPRIKVQNFGATTGTIIDVKTVPELSTQDMYINPFEYYNGLSLAPNQSFITVFARPNSTTVLIEEFDVEIVYKTLNKTVKSTCHINYKFIDGALDISIQPKDKIAALNNINQSIQGLQQK